MFKRAEMILVLRENGPREGSSEMAAHEEGRCKQEPSACIGALRDCRSFWHVSGIGEKHGENFK